MADPLATYFLDFLKRISLTPNQRSELIKSHTTLRKQLQRDNELSPIIEEAFLQGSYKRNTIVRHKYGKHSDVDIVVVMKLDINDFTPDELIRVLYPFLKSYYKGYCRRQTHSWGIRLPNVHMDVTPALSPWLMNTNNYPYDRMNSWKSQPLYIPDRRKNEWIQTNPVHINNWTNAKNARCNDHFTEVVKCIKWWRRVQSPSAKRLKGYPLECLVGQCCPDGIRTVEEGLVRTFNNMVTYRRDARYIHYRYMPPAYNVFEGMTDKQYNEFYMKVCRTAEKAKEAYNTEETDKAAVLWRKILEEKID